MAKIAENLAITIHIDGRLMYVTGLPDGVILRTLQWPDAETPHAARLCVICRDPGSDARLPSQHHAITIRETVGPQQALSASMVGEIVRITRHAVMAWYTMDIRIDALRAGCRVFAPEVRRYWGLDANAAFL